MVERFVLNVKTAFERGLTYVLKWFELLFKVL